MESIDKLKLIIAQSGLSQKDFAEKIGLNHIVLNRNLKGGIMTADMMKGIILNIDADLNWLFGKEPEEKLFQFNEDRENYPMNTLEKVSKAMALLEDIKTDLTRK